MTLSKRSQRKGNESIGIDNSQYQVKKKISQKTQESQDNILHCILHVGYVGCKWKKEETGYAEKHGKTSEGRKKYNF